MKPAELFQAGKLTDAISAALDEVKRHPTDTSRRGLLCELLCFAGELARADKQLETIGQQDPEALVGVSMFRQLIRAETARREFYTAGRLPEFAAEVSPDMRRHLDASIALREGQSEEAAELLGQAEQQRVHVRGVCDGKRFDDLRDLDDLTASFFEVLTSNGKYYWVPIESVELVELHAPKRPHDLLWRPAHMVVTNGPDGEVFLPTLYANTHEHPDDQLRLGRGTDWLGGDGSPAQGVGLRMFLIGDEDKSILQLNRIEIDAAS